MAFTDSSRLAHKQASPLAWEALMAQIDRARVGPLQPKPQPLAPSARLRQAARMLAAAGLAAGLIIAVAGVMMIKFL